MITEIDKDTLDFLAKRKLTFNQFCMCLMIHNKDYVGIIKYTAEIGFLTGGTVMRPNKTTVNELDDLISRGILKHDFVDKDDYYSLDNFTVTEKFTKGFLSALEDMAEELWRIYPPLFISGEEKPSKAWDYEEFKDKYLLTIKNDRTVHAKVIAQVKKLRYAKMNLKNFVGSRDWENTQDEQKPATRLY